MPANLDLDILRTLATGMDLGSFAKAAERLGRSQSAISLQLRKLEEQLGVELLRKQGRNLILTEAGEVMLGYARRLLALNDEALAAVRGPRVSGSLRFGLPQDFAETWFPTTLAQFSRAYPQTQIAVTVGRNAELLERLDQGELDLILILSHDLDRPKTVPILNLPMAWIGSRDPDAVLLPTEMRASGVKLVMFEAPCVFRRAAMAALDSADLAGRVVFTSPSLSGLWAAVAAGIGVTLRTAMSAPPTLRVLGPESSLPSVPDIPLLLVEAPGEAAGPLQQRFKEILLETCRAALGTAASDTTVRRNIRRTA
ncbi:MAG TPA: LysR substrate-binding domain-containing protein [Terriglobales bacterium]|nr:LysR substrate-binding domain-containing protein [Terriglobales bacterium]